MSDEIPMTIHIVIAMIRACCLMIVNRSYKETFAVFLSLFLLLSIFASKYYIQIQIAITLGVFLFKLSCRIVYFTYDSLEYMARKCHYWYYNKKPDRVVPSIALGA